MDEPNNNIEPFKSKYTVERSEVNNIIHLRMISPDNGKTHVEYYSYVSQAENDILTTQIENTILQEMEKNLDHVINNLDQDKRDKMNALIDELNEKGDLNLLIKNRKRRWI